MKKTVYIHIGSGKTGTSSIQQMLTDNNVELRKNKYLYILKGTEINHSAIINWHDNMEENIIEFFNIFKQELNKFEYNNLIISSEQMMGLNKKRLNLIKEIFNDNYEIKIIAYVRNQIDHMPTHFLQKQKDLFQTKKAINITDFFDINKHIYGNEHNFIMNNWEEVFGKNNIIIRLYDKKILENENVCIDFAKLLGVEKLIKNFDYFQNDSLIPEVSFLLSEIDRVFPELTNKSSKLFAFRQNTIIKKLLLLTTLYKKKREIEKSIQVLKDLEIVLKDKFQVNQLPLELSNAFELTKNDFKLGKKCSLIDDNLKQAILEYYKESSFRFAEKYLNTTEAQIYLKYYNDRDK